MKQSIHSKTSTNRLHPFKTENLQNTALTIIRLCSRGVLYSLSNISKNDCYTFWIFYLLLRYVTYLTKTPADLFSKVLLLHIISSIPYIISVVCVKCVALRMFSALFTNSVAVISWQSIYKWIKPKFICMSSITGERLSIKLHRKQFGSIGSELRTLTLIGNDCKVRYKFNVHTFVATTWV